MTPKWYFLRASLASPHWNYSQPYSDCNTITKLWGVRPPNDHQRQMHYGPRAIIPAKWIWINHPIDLDIQMVRESSRIDLKREKQHVFEYMAVSSPTKCIACSLDTYRGALYPISFFTFSCVFAFISPPKDGCHLSCAIVICNEWLSCCEQWIFWRGELSYAGGICVRKK